MMRRAIDVAADRHAFDLDALLGQRQPRDLLDMIDGRRDPDLSGHCGRLADEEFFLRQRDPDFVLGGDHSGPV